MLAPEMLGDTNSWLMPGLWARFRGGSRKCRWEQETGGPHALPQRHSTTSSGPVLDTDSAHPHTSLLRPVALGPQV